MMMMNDIEYNTDWFHISSVSVTQGCAVSLSNRHNEK